jgi:hypothetical protein
MRPPLRFPILPLLSNGRRERVEVTEGAEVVVGKGNVEDVGKGGGEEEGGEGKERGERIVGEGEGDDLMRERRIDEVERENGCWRDG